MAFGGSLDLPLRPGDVVHLPSNPRGSGTEAKFRTRPGLQVISANVPPSP